MISNLAIKEWITNTAAIINQAKARLCQFESYIEGIKDVKHANETDFLNFNDDLEYFVLPLVDDDAIARRFLYLPTPDESIV